jgi:hypothetical protein
VNTSITTLDLGCNGLKAEAGKALGKALEVSPIFIVIALLLTPNMKLMFPSEIDFSFGFPSRDVQFCLAFTLDELNSDQPGRQLQQYPERHPGNNHAVTGMPRALGAFLFDSFDIY